MFGKHKKKPLEIRRCSFDFFSFSFAADAKKRKKKRLLYFTFVYLCIIFDGKMKKVGGRGVGPSGVSALKSLCTECTVQSL